MKAHFWIPLRGQIGSLLREDKRVILVEVLAATFLPLFLAWTGLPPSVLPLLLTGWLSLWLRGKNWKEVGLRRPVSWPIAALTGVGTALAGVYICVNFLVPFQNSLAKETPSQASWMAKFPSNPFVFVLFLVSIWLLAALGEELVYRGYLLNRLVDMLGRSPAGWIIGLAASSLIFSLAHANFNWAVLLGGFLLGLVDGGLYLAGRRNLWFSILFHGAWDSIYLYLYYLSILGR